MLAVQQYCTHCFWCCVLFQFHDDPTQRRRVPVASELNAEIDEGVGRVHFERGCSWWPAATMISSGED